MNAQITAERNEVTVTEYDRATDSTSSTTYYVPEPSGYIRRHDSDRRYPKVCERLADSGHALWATPETLLKVIKREYRLRGTLGSRRGLREGGK